MYAFHSKASTVAQRLPETSEVLTDILDSLKTWTSRLCLLPLLGSKQSPPSPKTTIQVSATQYMFKRKGLHDKKRKNSLWIGSINQGNRPHPFKKTTLDPPPPCPSLVFLFCFHSTPSLLSINSTKRQPQHNIMHNLSLS